MSILAVYHISVALNINFNAVKSFRDTKTCKNKIPRCLDRVKK